MIFSSDYVLPFLVVFLVFVIFFFVLPIICFYVQVESRLLAKFRQPRRQRNARQQQQQQRRRERQDCVGSRRRTHANDRQGNVFTISDETSTNRFNDIFYIEPNSEEAARIRAQLEKDDKELPSYDEVMRMCNLTTPTAAAATSATTSIDIPSPMMAALPASVVALPAPPYSETDPIAQANTSRSVQIEMSPISGSASEDSVAAPSSQRVVAEPQTGSLTLAQTVSNSVV